MLPIQKDFNFFDAELNTAEMLLFGKKDITHFTQLQSMDKNEKVVFSFSLSF